MLFYCVCIHTWCTSKECTSMSLHSIPFKSNSLFTYVVKYIYAGVHIDLTICTYKEYPSTLEVDLNGYQWQVQDFPARHPAKNCMKMKEFGPRGAHVPWIRHWLREAYYLASNLNLRPPLPQVTHKKAVSSSFFVI